MKLPEARTWQRFCGLLLVLHATVGLVRSVVPVLDGFGVGRWAALWALGLWLLVRRRDGDPSSVATWWVLVAVPPVVIGLDLWAAYTRVAAVFEASP